MFNVSFDAHDPLWQLHKNHQLSLIEACLTRHIVQSLPSEAY